MKGKKGVLTATALLLYLGVGLSSLILGAAINSFIVDDVSFSDSTIATLQNSFVASITEFDIANETAHQHRMLYPKATEELQISIGLLIIQWDDLGNAIAGKNITDIEDEGSINRSYFVIINGNSTALDPFNHSQCSLTLNDDGNVDSYFCAFSFPVGNKTAGIDSSLDEVVISTSSTNHFRTFDVVTILPKHIPNSLTTTQDIIDYTWNAIKFTMELWKKILTYTFYFLTIGFGLSILFGIIWGLRWIYKQLSGDGT